MYVFVCESEVAFPVVSWWFEPVGPMTALERIRLVHIGLGLAKGGPSVRSDLHLRTTETSSTSTASHVSPVLPTTTQHLFPPFCLIPPDVVYIPLCPLLACLVGRQLADAVKMWKFGVQSARNKGTIAEPFGRIC